MLFEMLAGQRPFEGATIRALVGAILTQPMPDLDALRADVPVALVDLVSRLLAKNRAERIPSARLVGAEMESLMRPHWPSEMPKPRSGSTVSQAPVTTSAAPDQAVTPRRHNFPAQPTAFVGREAELAEVGELLSQRSVRLVTLVGPGGMGKTRLALEGAAVQLAQFAHGVYFV